MFFLGFDRPAKYTFFFAFADSDKYLDSPLKTLPEIIDSDDTDFDMPVKKNGEKITKETLCFQTFSKV